MSLFSNEELADMHEKYARKHPAQETERRKTRAEILVEVFLENPALTVAELAAAAEHSPSWVRKHLRAAGITIPRAPRRRSPAPAATEAEQQRGNRMTDEQKIAEVELALEGAGISLAAARCWIQAGIGEEVLEVFSELSISYGRLEQFADVCITLERSLGAARAEEIIAEEYEKYGNGFCQRGGDPEDWQIFSLGTVEERKALQKRKADKREESYRLAEEEAQSRYPPATPPPGWDKGAEAWTEERERIAAALDRE